MKNVSGVGRKGRELTGAGEESLILSLARTERGGGGEGGGEGGGGNNVLLS